MYIKIKLRNSASCWLLLCELKITVSFRQKTQSYHPSSESFSREVDDNYAPLDYAASSANFLPIFQKRESWPLKMGPTGFPNKSVRNYHCSLRNNPEECSSLSHNSQFLSGNLSRNSQFSSGYPSHKCHFPSEIWNRNIPSTKQEVTFERRKTGRRKPKKYTNSIIHTYKHKQYTVTCLWVNF
jgi:hypothetical protein